MHALLSVPPAESLVATELVAGSLPMVLTVELALAESLVHVLADLMLDLQVVVYLLVVYSRNVEPLLLRAHLSRRTLSH